MLTSPTQSNPLQELARSLTQAADTNRDGQISSDEFTAFLGKLLSGTNIQQGQLTPATSAARTAGTVLTSLGGGGALQFEGFDFGRPQNLEKSAKDAFAHYAMASGTMPRTKVEAEQWFNQHIRQQMESLGHRIEWVQGDKFKFSNWQGSFVVDFVRAADGPNPLLSWQADRA
jgi:hypothetical protein